MTEKKKYYPELNAKINFPEMEKNILNFWEEDKTFEKSVHNRDGAAEFVFLRRSSVCQRHAALRTYYGIIR